MIDKIYAPELPIGLFGGQVGEADNSHAARETSFDRRLATVAQTRAFLTAEIAPELGLYR